MDVEQSRISQARLAGYSTHTGIIRLAPQVHCPARPRSDKTKLALERVCFKDFAFQYSAGTYLVQHIWTICVIRTNVSIPVISSHAFIKTQLHRVKRWQTGKRTAQAHILSNTWHVRGSEQGVVFLLRHRRFLRLLLCARHLLAVGALLGRKHVLLVVEQAETATVQGKTEVCA